MGRDSETEFSPKVKLRVLARQVLTTAIAEIRQTNIAATAPLKQTKILKILAIAGAAAGAGIVLSSRGGSSSSGNGAATTPSIAFGSSFPAGRSG